MPSSAPIPEVSGVSGVSGYTPKETTMKQGKALPVSFEHDREGMTWGKVEKKHNDEFNPSDQPWSPDQGQRVRGGVAPF